MISNGAVTPPLKVRQQRKAIFFATLSGTWLSRGSCGVYVVVTGSVSHSFSPLLYGPLREDVTVAHTVKVGC